MTLDRDGPRYVLRVLDATTGANLRYVINAGMPDWAADAGLDPDAVQINFSEKGRGLELDWHARRPYRGGAPPSKEIVAEPQSGMTGSLVLDAATGVTVAAKAVPSRPIQASPEPQDLGPHAASSPGVIAFDCVGDRLFALKAQQSDRSARIVLEARNAHDGSTLWEMSLGEIPASRPSPRPQ